ncbi:hypothetical protein ACFXTH_034006 [Malus domestica]
MKHNLLSAFQFLRDNYCSSTLDSNRSVAKDHSTAKTLLRGSVKDGFYPLQSSTSNRSFSGNVPPSLTASAFVSIKALVKIWHSRLGHHSSPIFRKVLSRNKLAVQGASSVEFFCSDYAIAKNHKLPFKAASSSASHSFALLHCDVWGPAPILSVSGFRYYLLIVDDHTKYSWFFPLKAKYGVYSTFVTFKTYVENTVGNKIKAIRSDLGGEFVSSSFQAFLQLHGISHQLSCPHTPEQNGCVERKHRHLVETARTLLVASHVPKKYWVEAISTALYLINRLPISGLLCSPWELLFHTSQDYTRLKIFGCSCYPWLKPYVSSKLEGKSKECVFLDYSLQHKGYRYLDLLTDRVYISRHVLFNEKSFPFSQDHTSQFLPSPVPVPPIIDLHFPLSSSSHSPTPPPHPLVVPHVSSPSSSQSPDQYIAHSYSAAVTNHHPMVTR